MNNRSRFIAGALAAAALAAGGLGETAAHASAILTGNFAADNYGFAYISTNATTRGTLIGSAASWNPATALTTTNLADGTYYLNFEIINGDPGNIYSSGGFLGDFSLSGSGTFSTGTTRMLTGSAGWLGSYNDANYNNTQQAWVAPTTGVLVEGLNGISPWGFINGISAQANWIWAGDAQSSNGNSAAGNQCGACTVDFQVKITVPEPASWTVMIAGLVSLAGALAFRRRKAADTI